MPSASPVHRIEVRPRPGRDDPKARTVREQAAAAGVPLRDVRTARIYLVQADLSNDQLAAIRDRLLTDPVIETSTTGATPAPTGAQLVEVHPLPGVMDPAAQSVQEAIRDLVGVEALVSTGWRYDLIGNGSGSFDSGGAADLARQLFANPVIHAIYTEPFQPDQLPQGSDHSFQIRRIAIRDLSADQLARLSRDAHLFLSLDEMKAVQEEYRRIGREPTDIELETLAQTWSEHCVHKTLKSRIRYQHIAKGNQPDAIRWEGRPGHTVNPDGSVTIDNLLKSTVAAATFELIADGVDWTLSVFKDNSGVIALDDRWGVNVKVETHNRPSAIEPYGGAATGAGGCIRDVIGTGLGAKPIASTDVFCVAFPDRWVESDTASSPAAAPLPPGTLHPRRILSDVVAGVRDYGNRMGIPTVSGAVAFDDRYVGNPLVFCGCIGLIPRDLVRGAAREGDRIVALGGRTGRDGIHGATFSSAGLESTAATEFAHAVQIGNAIEERRLLEAILRARDEHGTPLFNAITDCGAGGFSSAIGEMGAELGAEVHLERAPLKYAGLSYTEIWISEAQERMILAVPAGNLGALRQICEEEHVELADLGHFGTPDRELILNYRGQEVGRLSTTFLHDGLPQPLREAAWQGSAPPSVAPPTATPATISQGRRAVGPALRRLLSHPNIASKHWIVRQYDHEVQGNTVLKPFVGAANRATSDAAVLEPIAGSGRGVAISQGLQTGIGDPDAGGDPYQMALAAIDECVRNLVCVGADPSRIAILDNFCWPSCAVPQNLGALVRAAEGCFDGAKAYRTPFVSGKDSLNNQLRYTDPATGKERVIEIPPTLLITGLGIVPDIRRIVTMDAKEPGNVLLLVGRSDSALGGSHYAQLAAQDPSLPAPPDLSVPRVDLTLGPAAARAVHSLIREGLIRSAHDVSDGGVLCAVAEMLIAGSTASRPLGVQLDLSAVHPDPLAAAFGEGPSRYILEVRPADLAAVTQRLGDLPWVRIGELTSNDRLRWLDARLDERIDVLEKAWLGTLDW